MKVRSMLVGAAVLAAVALTPNQASAQGTCGGATYSFNNAGLGGFLSGCFDFTLTELGENAGGIGAQSYWTNAGALLGSGSPNNASTLGGGAFFFNDDCGSTGAPGFANFRYCDGVDHAVVTAGTFHNNTGELVLGMNVTQPQENGGANYWIYSGAQIRNNFPAPAGFQAVLYNILAAGTGAPTDDYLFAWEDINGNCQAVAGSPLHPSLTTFRTEDLHNSQILDDPNNCTVSSTTTSDNDFNDSYIVLHIIGQRQDTVTPEPMTMTLMATGLVGLAGAQIRRRRKNQG